MEEQTFAQWLKQQRNAVGLTLRELADKLDVKHSYLSQLENELETPGEDLARRIAEVFSADEEWVVFLARNVAATIRQIKEKFPTQAPVYFRRTIEEEQR